MNTGYLSLTFTGLEKNSETRYSRALTVSEKNAILQAKNKEVKAKIELPTGLTACVTLSRYSDVNDDSSVILFYDGNTSRVLGANFRVDVAITPEVDAIGVSIE